MTGKVLRSRVGGVLHLVLDAAPRRNALSRVLISSLHDALLDLEDDVTAVVISGAGGTFSAGADFADITGTSADIGYDDAVTALTTTIRELPRIVVAALEGPCVGAGADLALACDFRVAAEDSYLQVPAVRLGLLYKPDAIDLLRRTFPAGTIRRLFLLGDRFVGEDALVSGLVTYVVPRGDAVKRATALLEPITVDQCDAIAATKALLHDQESGTADPDRWQQRRTELLDSPARQAAVAQARDRHTTKEN